MVDRPGKRGFEVANGLTLKAIGGLAAVSVTVPSVAIGAAAAITPVQQEAETPVQTDVAVPDAAAVAALVQSINAAVAALPADAKGEDIEAAIVFAVDQASQPENVVMAALQQVAATTTSPAVKAAVNNVIALRQRMNGQEGTGSIASNGDGLSFGPSLGVGGGSTDYTPAS
jgi:hypothetical protein